MHKVDLSAILNQCKNMSLGQQEDDLPIAFLLDTNFQAARLHLADLRQMGIDSAGYSEGLYSWIMDLKEKLSELV